MRELNNVERALVVIAAMLVLAVVSTVARLVSTMPEPESEPVPTKSGSATIALHVPRGHAYCEYGTVAIDDVDLSDNIAEWTSVWRAAECHTKNGGTFCDMSYDAGWELPRFQCFIKELNLDGSVSVHYACSKRSELRPGESFSVSGQYILIQNLDPSGEGHNCQLL
jgi:hypothetical protein